MIDIKSLLIQRSQVFMWFIKGNGVRIVLSTRVRSYVRMKTIIVEICVLFMFS